MVTSDLVDPNTDDHLTDDAINLISGMLLPENHDLIMNPQYDVDTIPMKYTNQSRERVLDYLKKLLPDFISHKRYIRGELMTLKHLVSELSSPHSAPNRRSAYNLLAITGQISLYDPYADLIANWDSIRKWSEYADNSTLMPPGNWVYSGQPIRFPV